MGHALTRATKEAKLAGGREVAYMVFPCNAHIYVTKLLASLKGTLSIAKTGNGSEHRGRSLNEDDVASSSSSFDVIG